MATSEKNERSDLVAFWSVPLLDRVHTVEFEHGGTTGKRVVRVDGKEILRREWMFKLVGEEKFTLGKQEAKCELRVDPLPFFTFGYSLFVDGQPLEKFTEKQNRSTKCWVVLHNGKRYRIVYEKQTLDVWVNGQIIETVSDFIEGGTEMKFEFEELKGSIKATCVNKKGIVHDLYIDDKLIEEDLIY